MHEYVASRVLLEGLLACRNTGGQSVSTYKSKPWDKTPKNGPQKTLSGPISTVHTDPIDQSRWAEKVAFRFVSSFSPFVSPSHTLFLPHSSLSLSFASLGVLRLWN